MELTDCDTGRRVISTLFSHDWGSPPQALVIEAMAKDGRLVRLVIPNDDSDTVKVAIEDRAS
jgi:hypothetical protein